MFSIICIIVDRFCPHTHTVHTYSADAPADAIQFVFCESDCINLDKEIAKTASKFTTHDAYCYY